MDALSQDLEGFVRGFYSALEEKNLDIADAAWGGDLQVVSEGTGDWVRDRRKVIAMVHEEVESPESYRNWLEGVTTRMVSDKVGVATFIWHGEVRMNGTDHRVRCPTTLLAERGAKGWQILLLHSTPLEASGG